MKEKPTTAQIEAAAAAIANARSGRKGQPAIEGVLALLKTAKPYVYAEVMADARAALEAAAAVEETPTST